MRAGNLDRVILIERLSESIDTYGVPQTTWATLATMRAELLSNTDTESVRESGASSDIIVTFKTRYLTGLTLADRVNYNGQPFILKDIEEIGRRRGLRLRAERIGP